MVDERGIVPRRLRVANEDEVSTHTGIVARTDSSSRHLQGTGAMAIIVNDFDADVEGDEAKPLSDA